MRNSTSLSRVQAASDAGPDPLISAPDVSLSASHSQAESLSVAPARLRRTHLEVRPSRISEASRSKSLETLTASSYRLAATRSDIVSEGDSPGPATSEEEDLRASLSRAPTSSNSRLMSPISSTSILGLGASSSSRNSPSALLLGLVPGGRRDAGPSPLCDCGT